MKGVILGIAPDAQLVDISHQIAPQDVRQAAYVLYTAHAFFPPSTIHLVVIDPGVGGARRAIALCTRAGVFVGPDNGVFSYIVAREPVERIVALQNPLYRLARVSQTFHGRDVFAPAAAHLAAGISIDELGPPIHDPELISAPSVTLTPDPSRPDTIRGEVLYVDHFGNVISSIGVLTWAGNRLCLKPAFPPSPSTSPDPKASGAMSVSFRADEAQVQIAGWEIVGIHRTYSEVAPGELVALVSSAGHLEVAVREGSGARRLSIKPGDEVTLCVH
jgi:hypothetical protein